MGRPRKTRSDLPKRVYFNHEAYYFVNANGKWIKLGKTHGEAMMQWAKLLDTSSKPVITIEQLLTRYVADVLPNKAPRTQSDNLQEISWLLPTFGAMALDAVKPQHIASYRDARKGKTRANREIALLSHAFNRGVEWGLIQNNPCEHVQRNKERCRDRYVEDEELEAFRMLCPTWLQAYIDLKCLIALRQQDMLTLRWADFEGERIDSVIKKVSKKLRIAKTNEISEVLSRLPRNGEFLFPLENGELRDKNAFHSVWGRVMHEFIEAGGMRFTEHDIRGKVATDMDDPYHAQKLLGHSSIQMTEGYIKQRKNNVVQPHSRKK